MKQHDKAKFNLIMNIVTLAVTGLLLVMTIFGWYVTNNSAKVSNATGATASNDNVHYKSLSATKFALTGNVTENVYTINGSTITLSQSDVYTRVRFKASDFKTDGTYYTGVLDSTTEEYTFTQVTSGTYDSDALYFTYESIDVSSLEDSEKTFSFLGMLPGEYIDVKVGFYLDDGEDGKDYNFKLESVTGGAFVVDSHTHYATGAYKYKAMSLTAKTGTPSFTPTDYEYFQTYAIDKDDASSVSKTLVTDTWKKSYEDLTLKFRIMEDFTQFYDLLGKAENTYGNLLNQKTFTIGSLFIQL